MSTHLKLNGKVRDVIGNRVKVLRREGDTPAVVYSGTFKSTPISVNTRELMKTYKLAGKTHVIDLNLDGKVQPVIVKSVDSHPFKHEIRHIDLYAVDLKTEIESTVPVILVGEAPAIKGLGAILNQILDEVTILCLPDNLPEKIEVELSSLVDFTDVIKISDLPKSKTYKIVDSEDTIIVSLTSQSVEKAEDEEVAQPAVVAKPEAK